MFLGATMFLASIGMASANPSTDTFGSNEPNPVVASPQQAKHTIKGVVEDQFGKIHNPYNPTSFYRIYRI